MVTAGSEHDWEHKNGKWSFSIHRCNKGEEDKLGFEINESVTVQKVMTMIALRRGFTSWYLLRANGVLVNDWDAPLFSLKDCALTYDGL